MAASRRSGELDPVLVNRNPEAAGLDNSSNNGVSGTNFSDESEVAGGLVSRCPEP